MTRRHIRKLEGEAEFRDFARLSMNAYPNPNAQMEIMAQRMRATHLESRYSHFWGVFEGDRMVGGMRILDFSLNYHGSFIPAGGVGAVATDLAERKRGVAKDIVTFFLDRSLAEGQYLAYLYPFRPDFYYQMGFGYGPKINQYTFLPESLPSAADGWPSAAAEAADAAKVAAKAAKVAAKAAADVAAAAARERVEYLKPDDLPLLEEFSARVTAGQHGYCRDSRFELEGLLKRYESRTVVGWKNDGKLRGYLSYSFKSAHPSNALKNNLVIHSWRWDSPEALEVTCRFLRSLSDQIHRVVFNTHQADFHFLLKDVRNATDNLIPLVVGHETNTAAVGVMYRIVDLAKLLESTAANRDYNGVTAKVALDVTDTFRPSNAGRYLLSFEGGKLTGLSAQPSVGAGATGAVVGVPAAADAGAAIPLSLTINELASLLMGSVEVSALHRLGRVKAPEESLAVLDQLFRPRRKPENVTYF